MRREERLLSDLRDGRPMGGRAAIALVWLLSVPTVLSELSTIAMEYIDAAMVGRIGAGGAAAIGLVATSTWLLWGLLHAATTGFAVIVAQEIGARRFREARSAMMQGFAISFGIAATLALAAGAIARPLPHWLGGEEAICADASRYFSIFMVAGMPIYLVRMYSAQMLQSAGDMRTAGVLNIAACVMDVIFNFIFIFPSHRIAIFGQNLTIPGLDLGVAGAAIGSVAAETLVGCAAAWLLLARHPLLRLRRGEPLRLERRVACDAAKVAAPIAFERGAMNGAMLVSTTIVAPLGAVALAANSFAITAESLCYMPGYGISSAATTLVGQAFGARRRALARRFAWICTWSGVACMSATGVLLLAFAPSVMSAITPDPDVAALGAKVLRIEAFAEPFFAASIVAGGALRGAGDTLVPSIMNLCSMWLVRIPLAAFLASRLGLAGAWVAMAVELCVRGLLMGSRLASPGWSERERVGE